MTDPRNDREYFSRSLPSAVGQVTRTLEFSRRSVDYVPLTLPDALFWPAALDSPPLGALAVEVTLRMTGLTL